MSQLSPDRLLPPFEEIHKNIVVSILLIFLTFGIYYLFWQAHQIQAMNKLMGREKYNFWKWFFLSFVTFGLYHIYHEYVMSEDIVNAQKMYDKEPSGSLPLISLICSLSGFPIIADALQQYEFHKLYGNDNL